VDLAVTPSATPTSARIVLLDGGKPILDKTQPVAASASERNVTIAATVPACAHGRLKRPISTCC
jgi:hypothetical protein